VGLAFPDASNLGRMQRIELPTALTLALIFHPASERERQGEDLCELRPTDNRAGDVANDAPEHRTQAPQGPVRPLELLSVGVALMPDQRDLADPRIGLAQPHPVPLGQTDQPLARPVHERGVGRERDCLLLHGRVDDDLPKVGGLGGFRADRDGQALLNQRDQPVLAQALAPAGQRRTIKRQFVLEDLLTAEQLVIRVLDPALV